MINKKKAAILVMALVVLAVAAIIILFKGQATAQAQQAEVRPNPVVLGQPMPDFTLPVYQGGALTLSSLRGKNVLILFPRGYAAENYWCTICNYRYAELAELEKAEKIREKYNVEVLVVFPYPRDIVKSWLEALPSQLETVRSTKNPADPSKLDEKGKLRMERFRQLFPTDYSLEKGAILAPFPILVDGERTLSKSLGLFQTEWNGSKVDQNIPSIYIIDANGVLQFKYLGQTTVDRPGYDYLLKVLTVINAGK
ncbi:MAG: redoxin domain-containing protein [Candidatus Aminicenantes bacterium]|nr:redoxin domain-containing protein [Candidatus Aminicenantes bacterium]